MGSKKDRILWVFPNYRTVDEAESQPRITSKDKLTIAVKDSFDPYAFPIAGVYAGIAQWQNQPPSWKAGLDGYRDRYLAAFADQTTANMFSEAVFPIILHQDPRYLRLGRGGFWHRFGYSVKRVFVTRTDDGEPQINYSGLGGDAVMVAASNLYYPPENRTLGVNASRYGIQLGLALAGNFGKEFWPDVKRWLVGPPKPKPEPEP